MKPYIPIAIATIFVVLALITLILARGRVEGEEVVPIIDNPPTLTSAQIIWLARLMNCESGINHEAINPNDLDNTPSWGILQFKPSTFETFTVKYGIDAELMNAEAQVDIVTYWLLHPGEVQWGQQFPACVRKLGLPPQ